jgi:PAS domain S-box-containing protein
MATQAHSKEQLLAESNRLRTILNSIGDAVIATDLAGCIVAMNPVAEALTGWEETQAHGKPLTEVFEIVNAQTGKLASNPAQRVLETGKIAGLANHTKLIAKDGAEYQIADSAAPIMDAEGKTQGVVLVFRDVTEEYTLREALQESEARFRVAQELSPDGFTILHPLRNNQGKVVDFTWVYENQTIARINDTDPDKVIGKRLLDLFPSHHGTPVFEAYRQVADTGKSRILEDVYVGEIISKPTWLRLVVVSMGQDIAILTQDITEWVQAEEALRTSEERLDLAMMIKNEGIWDWDLATNQVDFDDRYYSMAGYQPGEFAHTLEEFQKRVYPEDLSRVMATAEKHLSGEIPVFTVEFRFKHKNRSWIWIQGQGKIFERTEDGRPKRFIGTHTDITERVQAEGALRESEEKFRTLFETMSEGVVYQDAEGKITSANPAAERLLGLSLAQMQGKTSLDPRWKAVDQHGNHIPGEQHPAMVALRTGKKVENFLMGVNIPERDEVAWIIVNAVPQFKAGNDSPYQVYATFVDITERMQAEAALQESEEKYRSLFHQSTEGIFLHDLRGQILDVNERACAQSGYTKAELLGLSVFDLYPSESQVNLSRDEILQVWHEWMPGQRHLIEAEHQRKDGAVYPVEISTGLVHYKDENALLAIVKDITERVQREARIEHLNQVLRAIRDVNQLITQEKDREALLWRACDILTSTRGYGNAWVALRGEDGQAQTVAESGINDFAPLRQAMAQGDWPKCCQQAWAHTDKIVVIYGPNQNCTTCNLSRIHRDTAAMAGTLRYGQQDFGVLVVALPVALAEDHEEQALFRELVDDLAYALHNTLLDEERKAVVEALRSNEEKYRTLVNSTLQGVVIAQSDPVRLVFANPAMAQISGYPPERLIGMGPQDLVKLIHEEDRREFFSNFQKRLQGISILSSSEYRLVTKQGSVKWIALYSSLIEYENGPATLTTFMDITERKRAEEGLRQLKDRLQEEVAEKTRELQERIEILERFHAATITRELRMKELRDEIARLKGEKK